MCGAELVGLALTGITYQILTLGCPLTNEEIEPVVEKQCLKVESRARPRGRNLALELRSGLRENTSQLKCSFISLVSIAGWLGGSVWFWMPRKTWGLMEEHVTMVDMCWAFFELLQAPCELCNCPSFTEKEPRAEEIE